MSTIKVDTYLTRGGASEIAIDKLKGVSSASSISVVAEGGSTTTNLQQGLAKVLASLDTTGTAEVNNSFNLTSITDNNTGDYTLTIANNLGSAFSYCSFMCGATSSFDDEGSAHMIARATDTHRMGVTDIHNSADATDYDPCMFTIHGDLA